MTDVTVTLRAIHDLIAATARQAGRDPAEIRLIAVSKTHEASLVKAAMAAGHRDFAENYLQEAIPKIQALSAADVTWHYIGRIQGNKTRPIATHFDWVQTVDRLRIARRLNNHRDPERCPLNVCLQVRLSDDPERPGAPIDQIPALADDIDQMPNLRLRGLMCMPPLESDADAARRHFDVVRRLFESLCDSGRTLDTLSMGTSADLTAAIRAGSTMVRVGTAIFGPRH